MIVIGFNRVKCEIVYLWKDADTKLRKAENKTLIVRT